jgi:hypothetical protein
MSVSGSIDTNNKVAKIVLKEMRDQVPTISRNSDIIVTGEDMREIENQVVNTIERNTPKIEKIIQQEGIDHDLIRRNVNALFTMAFDQMKGNRRNQLKPQDIAYCLSTLQKECKRDFPFWR